MKAARRRLLLATLLPALLIGVWLGLLALLVPATMEPNQRSAFWSVTVEGLSARWSK